MTEREISSSIDLTSHSDFNLLHRALVTNNCPISPERRSP